MNNELLTLLSGPNLQTFVASHEGADVQKFLLKNRVVEGVPAAWVAHQIIGRQKAKSKLPTWYATPGIVYPPAINIEQCSSELTARYKQTLLEGNRAVDLTGGFGVDSFFLSRAFREVNYVEPDKTLSLLVPHNHSRLGATNIHHHQTSSESFLKSNDEAFDLAFLDPSRRQGARKVFRLADCSPDVIRLKDTLLKRAKTVLIKTSPLLDLKQAYRELGTVDRFIVLAVENEVRELLVQFSKHEVGEPNIQAVSLDKNGEPTTISFTWSEEKEALPTYGAIRKFIYEPNAAILKAGAFKWVSQRYNLNKLAPLSHWYTSDVLRNDFPGRAFEVIEPVALNKKLRDLFQNGSTNIVSRNHPLSVAEIRRKTGLTEGGHEYLLCTTASKPVALRARRMH